MRKVAEMQPVGQLVEFYKTERRKFKQGVKRIDSLLYTWENWQSYLSFAPEEEDFGLSVKDVSHQRQRILLCYSLMLESLACLSNMECRIMGRVSRTRWWKGLGRGLQKAFDQWAGGQGVFFETRK